MQKPLSSNIAEYLKAHLRKKRWKQVVTVLACLVVFGTTYALILPAITMTGATFCGKEEHTHSAEAGCYTPGEPHVHTDECYKEASVLTCGLAETEGHMHGESCYDEDGNLICGQEEAEAHTHTEACYTTQETLVCGKDEGAVESVLTCEKEEHAHTLACYSNPDADTDAPALPALSGNAAADAAAIAKAQLGYAESSKNYAVAPDGETAYGYTCYGAAYGNAYADDWSALFARYCLDEAGVSEAFPREDTCAGWIAALTEQELYHDAASYTPKPGDAAFYDLDGDGAAEHAGIVLDAETAAVGDVAGKVEKEELTAAAGFGALPTSGPKKAAAADPSKPTFKLEFSGNSHGTDGEWLFYTGETFKANVSLSDNAQDGEQTTEDDGMVARIYMRFTKTVPPTGNSSAGGMPSVATSGTITANNGNKYKNTVTCIRGEDSYTYCYDIQRPLNGDTLNIDLPCAYPSPGSAGGTVEIWGMILTKEEKEALDGGSSTPKIQEPAEGEAVTARWETKRDDFTLSKTNATTSRLPYISSDDDGNPTITRLRYHVGVKRDTTQTLEGIGKDFLASVTYVDTLTLPENTHFDAEVIEAANNGTYVLGSNTQDSASGGDYKSYYYYVTKDTKKPVFAISYSTEWNREYTEPSISFSEDGRSVSISWSRKNKTIGDSRYTPAEYTNDSVGVQLPDIHIEKLEEGLDYTVTNNVTATYHYRWSEDVTRTASCENTVSIGKAEMSYSKSYWSGSTYGGGNTHYKISATNKGSLPFENLAFIKDSLPDVLYMSAANMYTMFTDETYGKGFSIEISNATICNAASYPVKTVDGSEATATEATVSPDDLAGKYAGMWTGSDPTVLVTNASLKVGWNEEKTALVISRLASEGVEAKTVTCEVTKEAIQSALDELGLFVARNTTYRLQWDLRDENGQPKRIYNGHPVSIDLWCANKDTFMILTEDRRQQYPWDCYLTNVADFQDTNKELLNRASAYRDSWYKEISLNKSVTSQNGSAITDENAPQNGDAVNYTLQIKHSGSGTYDLLPVTDHMTGAQVLLAEKEKNETAGWAADCQTVTVDGTEYYKLSREETYSGVWLGEYYADTVTVSAAASGRDTLIKWYLKDYAGSSRTDIIGYKALVCPQELSVSGMTFTLDNESWLNDHVAHRLYDTIGTITGSTISFDKKIVSESDVGAEHKEDGQTESTVSEGETVYYRIALHPAGEGSEEAGSITFNGESLRDSLPLGFSKNETDKFEWRKSEDKTPGSVWIVGYEGATTVTGGWNIADSGTKNQQEIVWDDDFSVTFPSNKPLYIYIRLTFPSGADWQDYAVQNNKLTPTNTFYLNGMGSAVTHTLKLEAKAYLQKGVYRNYYWYSNSVNYFKNSDLTSYVNGKGVIYYVALCNDGNTRLYLTDMQDILPKGFTFESFGYSGSWRGSKDTTSTTAFVKREDNGRSYQLKSANVECITDKNDPQKLTFRYSHLSYSSTSAISYDEARGLCYLNPGEAINFCYRATIGHTASTDEAATNGIAMPYYDYNLGGVSISDNSLTLSQTSTDVDNPNDGDCRLVDNTQITSGGFTGESNDTQWLYSEVTQYRSEIKPGISKRLAAAVSANGTVTENPIAARPEDTLRWEVTVYNDGGTPLEDFIVTDVMQVPYKFTGTVRYNGSDLFSIISLGAKSGRVQGFGNPRDFTINGNWVYVEPKFDYNKAVYLRVTKDEETENYALSIRFPAKYYSVAAGDTLRLTYDTKRTDGGNENTVFVNTCYVTPAQEQTWDGTTNHGNVTTFDPTGEDENRMSVRNSAPVTTAYGFATSSLKTVELTNTPETKATGNDGTNYIVLPDKDKRNITYTLQVDAPEKTAMTSLIFIDTLPYVDDHTSFQQDDPRFSEFAVDFADDPNVTVTVTDENGVETTLDAGQYTVSYSDKTEFDSDDWRGVSAWIEFPTGMRTLRVAITDKDAIPGDSHVTVRFNAVVGSDADYGQSAWNSFGYHYGVGSGQELEAAPLKVGVKMPTRPYLQKSLVDRGGKSVIAKQDETFRFLLYSGNSLKTADEAAIAGSGRTVSVIELTVPQGESASEKMMLKDLKVWTYADGQWTQTDTDWTWTQTGSYTIVELPQSDDPEYRFQSLNRRTDATGYTFIYQNDQTQQISAVNLHDVWSLTIRKVDQTAQDLTIAGAWFALYSPEQADALDYDSLRDNPTNKPAETIEQDGTTWYLAQVAQTGNVESEQGSLTWSGLRRETYLYQEIQAPKGYLLDPAIRTITKTGYPQTVTITNEGAGYELPQTGGPGVAPFLLSGGLIFGGAAFALLRRRKRKGAA